MDEGSEIGGEISVVFHNVACGSLVQTNAEKELERFLIFGNHGPERN